MKTLFAFFAAILIFVPAQAVVITCVNESNAVRIDYDASDETLLPIAFSLDITVSSPAVITKVYDFKIGDSSAASPGFGIFPGSMQFDPGGNVVNWGTPDLTGIGTSKVTIGMASRYYGDVNAPAIKGKLCRILIDTRGASSVNVNTALNANGGGIVLENAAEAKFSSIGCTIGSSTPLPSLPAAPASINYPAASSTGQYTVMWPASSNAISYQLERSANSDGTWLQVYSGSALLYYETITNGSYIYRVRSTNSAGSSGWTTGAICIVSIPLPPTPVPQAPASISYPTTNNTGKYNVNWSSSTGATSYQLERSANNGSTWTQIYSGSGLSHSETVTNGTYKYRVRASNSSGSSLWRTGTENCIVSIPATPSTVPAAPKSISYPESSRTGKYTIRWSASNNAASYQLERFIRNSRRNGTWTRIYSGSALSFPENVGNGKYLYRVRAVNSKGVSSWKTGKEACEVQIRKNRNDRDDDHDDND